MRGKLLVSSVRVAEDGPDAGDGLSAFLSATVDLLHRMFVGKYAVGFVVGFLDK